MNFHCFQSLEDIAKDYIGEIVYVGWPHLYQAKVISVSDDDARFVDSKGYYQPLNTVVSPFIRPLLLQWKRGLIREVAFLE